MAPDVWWKYGARHRDSAILRRLAPGRPRPLRPSLVSRYRLPVETAAGWVVDAGKCTLDLDAAHVWSESVAPSPASNLRITHVTGKSSGVIDHFPASPQDLAGCALRLAIYSPAGAGATDPGLLTKVRVFLGSGADWANYRILDTNRLLQVGGLARTGWQVWIGSAAAPSSADVGVPNLGAISRIRVTLTTTGTDHTVAVTLGELHFFAKPAGTPLHLIHFDDGYPVGEASEATLETAAEYMAARGLRGTFYICLARMQSLPRYQRIAAMGHLVGNHSTTHASWKTDGLTDEQKLAEVLDMAAYLEANGLAEGARHFAQPNGTTEVVQGDLALAAPYLHSWRMTQGGGAAVCVDRFPVYYVQVPSTPDDVPAARALLARSQATGLSTASYFHLGVQAGMTDYLDEMAAAQDAGAIRTATPEELF